MAVSSRARASIQTVLRAVDVAKLADVYCDHGGDEFFADRMPVVLDLGLKWAKELLARLPRGGASVYVGAGVAELPAMIAEVVDLERNVRASNLRAPEVDVLNAALRAAGLPALLECVDAGALASTLASTHDHVSMVSVLSDPETFPNVSGIAYGRLHPVHVDLAALAAERTAIEALVGNVGAALTLPGLITTTVEEVPWFLAWAERHGRAIGTDETMLDTAIVGDPIGFIRVGTPDMFDA